MSISGPKDRIYSYSPPERSLATLLIEARCVAIGFEDIHVNNNLFGPFIMEILNHIWRLRVDPSALLLSINQFQFSGANLIPLQPHAQPELIDWNLVLFHFKQVIQDGTCWDNYRIQPQYRRIMSRRLSHAIEMLINFEEEHFSLEQIDSEDKTRLPATMPAAKETQPASPLRRNDWYPTDNIKDIIAQLYEDIEKLQVEIRKSSRSSNDFPLSENECLMLASLFEAIAAELRGPYVQKERIVIVHEYTENINQRFKSSLFDWGIGKVLDTVSSGLARILDAFIGVPATSIFRMAFS